MYADFNLPSDCQTFNWSKFPSYNGFVISKRSPQSLKCRSQTIHPWAPTHTLYAHSFYVCTQIRQGTYHGDVTYHNIVKSSGVTHKNESITVLLRIMYIHTIAISDFARVGDVCIRISL